ncbi:MAG: hypothetical protein HY808_12485 [Nitrospirae bacterium]|nr:hypothetical protein [Nitrospirota bacterium]
MSLLITVLAIDNLNITLYIAINLLLFFSWHVFLFRQRKVLSFVDRIIGAFILGLAQIIATETLLGVVFRKLFAAPLFWLNISISAIVLIYAVSGSRNKQSFAQDIFSEIRNSIITFFDTMKSDLIFLIIFVLFFISACWIIFLGYLFPSYTWDALWYHLPIVGYIMQSGAIKEVSNHSFINQFINIFPKNIELFFLWNIIFLKSDVISDLCQLLFTFIGMLTIYSIAVKLKVGEKHAAWAGLLFFFAPVIILQSSTNYVDIAVSVLFLVAINFLLCNSYPSSFSLLLAGLTTGILLGSKGSGPLFVIILSAAFLVKEVITYLKLQEIKSLSKTQALAKSSRLYLIYFLAPILLIGGYWYVKNWILYGNPVYPMEISVFNITIFKGLYKGIIEPAPEVFNGLSYFGKLFYVWAERAEYYFYDSRLSGFGPLWFILFLPAFVFSFVYALIKKRFNFIAVSAVLIAAFLFSPRNWNTRYVIFLFGLGAISFGFILDHFVKREGAIKTIALLLAVYVTFTADSPCVTPSQVRKFIHLPAGERTVANHAPFSIDLHARQEYGHWIWISKNISKGDTLAYTFEPLFLSPLWNSAFSSRMVYIKSDTYNDWSGKLGENNTTHILVRTNSEEDKWIEKERAISSSLGWLGAVKEKFKVVYSDDNYKIVKVLKNEG